MTTVLPSVTVGTIVSNGVPASTRTAIALRTYLCSRGIPADAATAGETLALDPANVTVTVISPPAAPGSDRNGAPVVIRPAFGSRLFLPAGDAGTTAEGWMLAPGRPVAARLLKAGHNGSDSARERRSPRPWIPRSPRSRPAPSTPAAARASTS